MNRYLFSNKWKRVGWICTSLSIISMVMLYLDYSTNVFPKKDFMDSFWEITVNTPWDNGGLFYWSSKGNILDEITLVLYLLGTIMLGFSKLQIEDEFTYKLRSESLTLAFIITNAISLVGVMICYTHGFQRFAVINLLICPALFVLIFHWNLKKLKSQLDEE